MTDEEAMEALLNSGVYSFPTWTLKLGLPTDEMCLVMSLIASDEAPIPVDVAYISEYLHMDGAVVESSVKELLDRRLVYKKLKREQLFGEMSPEELNKLITTDRYFQFERDIVEDGLHFIVCDQGVYDALMTLPGAKRKIVLLSYFGEMNDREIGDALGTGRANVQYHRSRALAMMRKTLEQESEEY